MAKSTQISEWEATPSHWTYFLGRDPFGRPSTIRPPDGAAHDVTFTYTGERLVSRTVKIGTSRATNGTINETPATTTEEYDGQLRLWKVTEPAGGQTADYRYDVGQRLSEVRLTQGVNQYRYFTYDNRGFMTSEQHPETGVITYAQFDARGHAGRMQRGPNDLTTTWDRAERVTQIRETSGQQRVLKEFTDADPDGMRRPEEIRTTGAISASLGVHRYDGAGNVVARGAEYYLYDLVSRLVRYNTTTSSYQSYGYDTYGNMTSLSFFNGSTTTTRGFSINVATNQLSGAATYDTAGNLTNWGGPHLRLRRIQHANHPRLPRLGAALHRRRRAHRLAALHGNVTDRRNLHPARPRRQSAHQL